MVIDAVRKVGRGREGAGAHAGADRGLWSMPGAPVAAAALARPALTRRCAAACASSQPQMTHANVGSLLVFDPSKLHLVSGRGGRAGRRAGGSLCLRAPKLRRGGPQRSPHRAPPPRRCA